MTQRFESYLASEFNKDDDPYRIKIILEAIESRSDAIWYDTDEYGRPIENCWPLSHYL